MARTLPTKTLLRTSATSIRHFSGHSKPPPPPCAPMFRKSAAVLLLAAAVALPCAVLYRAAALNAVQPMQVGWDRRPWWQRDQLPPTVMLPDEDGDVDPAVTGDPVRFTTLPLPPPRSLCFLIFSS
ncbi:hypothetical protein GUJ93_ZPchr0002g24518 [Zizania palustris]|uniref:Uncharacterized protein n=1 Tax=Zizania palustris TaxID=103762 RepID=A0A8J5VBU8_ZIZPA|nr:hypothetical protein GUJ93_ZPchr0002g24518 [Zizania palustris]